MEDLEEDEENKEIEEENPLDEQHKEVINEMKEEYPKMSSENGSILVDSGFQDLLKVRLKIYLTFYIIIFISKWIIFHQKT